jgi:hypothetical protein
MSRNNSKARAGALRRKIIALWLLNAADAAATFLLFQTGGYIEANILMRRFLRWTPLFFGIKIIMPTLLMAMIFKRLGKADEAQNRTAALLLNSSIALYLAVDILNISLACARWLQEIA